MVIQAYVPYKESAIKYHWLPATALFILSPLLSMPIVLYGVYRQKISGYVLFSLFLGLLAWLQVPLGDLFRHSLETQAYLGMSFSEFVANKGDSDFVSSFGKWFLVNNDLPYQWYRLFWVAESFLALALPLRWMMLNDKRVYTYKDAFIRFGILFLFFEFIMNTNGVRYCCACYNYVLALHFWINRKKLLLAIITLLLVTKIHSAMMFLIPLSFIIYLITRKRNAGLIVALIMMCIIILTLSEYGHELLGRRADFYFDGGKIGGNKMGATWVGFILHIAMRVFLLPFAYLSYKYFSIQNKWCRVLFSWVLIMLIFISNENMIFRAAVPIGSIGVLTLVYLENFYCLRKKFINTVVWCGVMTTLFNTVNYHPYILNSHYERIITPVPMILDYTYSISWIQKNIHGNHMINSRTYF